MAYGEYSFVRTKMSDAAKSILFADDIRIENWETFVEEVAPLGHKISIRYDLNYGGCSVSITGHKDSKNDKLILSAFGSDIESACANLQQLLALCGGIENHWKIIEREIKSLEDQVAQIIRDNLDKLVVNSR